MTPDSLRSEEEKALYKQLEDVIYQNCTVNNGQFEITISKREWEKRKLPDMYYEKLKKDILDTNNFIDTCSHLNKQLIVEVWRDARDEYFARRITQKHE